MKLTDHFLLGEFLPEGYDPKSTPGEVVAALMDLAEQLLEPLRAGIGVEIRVTSGYRPASRNAIVGGVPQSDHTTGHAADLQALVDGVLDEAKTREAFTWLVKHGGSSLGQVILEDHRESLNDPGKLWVHVALTSKVHADRQLINRVLVSTEPLVYRPVTAADLA